MQYNHKKLIISIVFLGFFALLSAQTFTKEPFSFPIKNGELTLGGVLTIPANFVEAKTPLVVFVAPPQSHNRDYGGSFKALSDSLAQNGIATYRYDNRNFSDSIPKIRNGDRLSVSDNANGAHDAMLALLRNGDRFSVFDIANDAHDAIVALQKGPRFSDSPIGLLGHSEGGNAVAIEASKNPDIRYVVVLSTIGISGAEQAYIQMTSQSDAFSEMLSRKDRNTMRALQYNLIKIIHSNKDNEIVRSLITKYLIEVSEKLDPSKSATIDPTELLLSAYIQPRMLEYIRYNPELYYPKIKCPILAVSGKRDEKVVYKINLDGLERIFIENEKEDYSIVAIDGVNHAYEDVDCIDLFGYISPHSQKRGWTPGVGFNKLCSTVVNWIKEN